MLVQHPKVNTDHPLYRVFRAIEEFYTVQIDFYNDINDINFKHVEGGLNRLCKKNKITREEREKFLEELNKAHRDLLKHCQLSTQILLQLFNRNEKWSPEQAKAQVKIDEENYSEVIRNLHHNIIKVNVLKYLFQEFAEFSAFYNENSSIIYALSQEILGLKSKTDLDSTLVKPVQHAARYHMLAENIKNVLKRTVEDSRREAVSDFSSTKEINTLIELMKEVHEKCKSEAANLNMTLKQKEIRNSSTPYRVTLANRRKNLSTSSGSERPASSSALASIPVLAADVLRIIDVYLQMPCIEESARDAGFVFPVPPPGLADQKITLELQQKILKIVMSDNQFAALMELQVVIKEFINKIESQKLWSIADLQILFMFKNLLSFHFPNPLVPFNEDNPSYKMFKKLIDLKTVRAKKLSHAGREHLEEKRYYIYRHIVHHLARMVIEYEVKLYKKSDKAQKYDFEVIARLRQCMNELYHFDKAKYNNLLDASYQKEEVMSVLPKIVGKLIIHKLRDTILITGAVCLPKNIRPLIGEIKHFLKGIWENLPREIESLDQPTFFGSGVSIGSDASEDSVGITTQAVSSSSNIERGWLQPGYPIDKSDTKGERPAFVDEDNPLPTTSAARELMLVPEDSGIVACTELEKACIRKIESIISLCFIEIEDRGRGAWCENAEHLIRVIENIYARDYLTMNMLIAHLKGIKEIISVKEKTLLTAVSDLIKWLESITSLNPPDLEESSSPVSGAEDRIIHRVYEDSEKGKEKIYESEGDDLSEEDIDSGGNNDSKDDGPQIKDDVEREEFKRLLVGLLKFHTYYISEENRKGKYWHARLAELVQYALNLYHHPYKNYALRRLVAKMDETIALIKNDFFHGRNSRLAEVLSGFSSLCRGKYRANNSPSSQFPAALSALPEEKETRAFLSSSHYVEKNTVLAAKILRVLDYYLDNHIWAHYAATKPSLFSTLKFNQKKNRWRSQAEFLRREVLEAVRSGENNLDIVAKVTQVINTIRANNYYFGFGSRLAETLSQIVMPYGSTCKPKNAKRVIGKLTGDLTETEADGYHGIYHVDPENDEALKLLGEIILICAYYCDMPLARGFVKEYQSDLVSEDPKNIFNTQKTKWRPMAQRLMLSAVRAYHENPGIAKSCIFHEIDRIIAVIHAGRGGKNSRLARQLEQVASKHKDPPTFRAAMGSETLHPGVMQKIAGYCLDVNNCKVLMIKFCLQYASELIRKYPIEGANASVREEIIKQLSNAFNDIDQQDLESKSAQDIKHLGITKFIENIIKQCMECAGGKIPVFYDKQFTEMLFSLDKFLGDISAEQSQSCQTGVLTGYYPVYRVR